MKHVHNTLIVGAGPIGIELHVALKQAGVDVLHVDAGQIGDTLHWWAPGTKFFSSPERIAISGVPLVHPEQEKATREQYLTYLRSVVKQFQLPIRTFERVTDITRHDNWFEVVTTTRRGETKVRAEHVVLAIGDMHAPSMLNIPGEELPHVSHYFKDPHLYFNRRVLIVGGKNSAVEAAIRLYRVGCDVTISYRQREFDTKRVKYWLHPELNWLIDKGKIGFLPETTPVSITPEHVELSSVNEPGERVLFDADDVLLLTGYVQDGSLFEAAGVHVEGEQRAPVFDRQTMETNVPGLFVAGTAVAGTQIGGVKVFIETAHIHVDRIVRAIAGREVQFARGFEVSDTADLPES